MSSQRDGANFSGNKEAHANRRDGSNGPRDGMSQEEMAALLAVRPQPRYRGEPFSAWKAFQRQEPDKAFIDWKKAMVNEGPTRSNSARGRSILPPDQQSADKTLPNSWRRAGSTGSSKGIPASRTPPSKVNSDGKPFESTNRAARESPTEATFSAKRGVDAASKQRLSPTRNVQTENVRFTNVGQR